MNNQENNSQQNTEQPKRRGPAVRPPYRESPLGNPDLRPVMPGKETLFAVLALLVCFVGASLALSSDNTAVSSLCAAAALVAGLIWTCRAGKKLTCILMALLPTGLWFFTGSMTLAALYAGGLCITVATARLYSHKQGKIASLALALAFAFSLFIGGLVGTLLPLGFALAGIVMALLTMTFSPRVGTICAMTVSLLATLIGVGLLTVVSLKGSCSGEAILAVVTDLRDQIVSVTEEMLAEYVKIAAAAGQETGDAVSHDTLVTAVNTILHITPALGVLLCMIPAFFAQIIFVTSCENEANPVYTGPLLHRFVLSPMAAVVFLLCEICALFAWNDNAFAAVIENLYLIMLPGLFLVGMFNALNIFRPRTKSHAPTVIMVLACCFMPAFMIPLLGFFGAYLIVRGNIAALIASRRNRGDGV